MIEYPKMYSAESSDTGRIYRGYLVRHMTCLGCFEPSRYEWVLVINDAGDWGFPANLALVEIKQDSIQEVEE